MARYGEGDRYVQEFDLEFPRGGGDFQEFLQNAPPPIRDEANTETVTPDALTATANDYSLGNGVFFRLSTSGGAQTITGFADVKAGRIIYISNVAGGNNIVLANQNAGSTAEYRIITGTGANVNVTADQTRKLWYDGVSTRWRLVE